MRRKVYDQLKKWKEEQNGESAVLINGARRVGKSYIVKEFAQEEYKSYILLDFNKIGKNIKSLFETYLDDLDTFFMYLSSGLGDVYKRQVSPIHLYIQENRLLSLMKCNCILGLVLLSSIWLKMDATIISRLVRLFLSKRTLRIS